MKKSVYSLVLMDDVVRAVDEEAYRQGTSRSNLINQILAEHLSCTTPEMRMQNIFNAFSGLLDSCFQLQPRSSGSLIAVRTALKYRYNPTVNYKVELLRSPDKYIGTLKVHIRTQNQSLTELFSDFFRIWTNLELSCIGNRLPAEYSAEVDESKFSRKLFNPHIDEDSLGEKIYSYINLLDSCIKCCFADKDNFRNQLENTKTYYLEEMRNSVI
ncbi:MAG: ribbon-helix-helix domain-containing protein [Oscillospiraceae bacterium]|nr:ribbon-helix-helix domain-containing protein [Oscillospiraceae bacterium]